MSIRQSSEVPSNLSSGAPNNHPSEVPNNRPSGLPNNRPSGPRPRRYPDGTISYPTRGAVPICPDGYEPIEGYTHIFRPILEECKYRENREPTKHCCGKSIFLYCKLLKRRVNHALCLEKKICAGKK